VQVFYKNFLPDIYTLNCAKANNFRMNNLSPFPANLHCAPVSATEVIPIRHAVLRQGKPVASCYFQGDDAATTQHWGVFENGLLIGVASVYAVARPDATNDREYQLRGMAILPEHQGKSIGKRLLTVLENALKSNGVERIWCNARTGAVPFYQRLGYVCEGNEFEIPEVGPHWRMVKTL
jgi:GNAT superfamily N-acetyltransferase